MFERHYRELLNFLIRKVRDQDLAADLAQESCVRVCAVQRSGVDVRDDRALLFRVARNLVIDHQRHADIRASVELQADLAEADDAPASSNWEPEATLASRQGVMALVATIDSLPLRCRQAFMLNRFDDMSYAQVARHMGISVKAVEQHIKHALDACERCRAQTAGEAAAPPLVRKKLNRSRQS